MKVTGIIAEYNPFHNGHKYQFEQIRKNLGSDYIVVVMNGDFMQRGEPAIVNKYARTHMALAEGADLVIELPVLYGTGSAEFFAAGGVRLLQSLHSIDHICFGCEYTDLSALQTIASIYAEEPDDFKELFQQSLRQGISYPKARASALRQYAAANRISLPEEVHTYMTQPNTILAVEYLKAIYSDHADIEPYLILRKDSGYHSGQLDDTDHACSSATAIRSAYSSGGNVDAWKRTLPKASGLIMQEAYHTCAPVGIDQFYPLIQYSLWQNQDRLTDYQDITEELANRLLSVYQPEFDYTGYVDAIVNKQYTRTRIMRCLLHLLLGITKAEVQEQMRRSSLPYARILGFRSASSELLKAIREQADLRIIQQLKKAQVELSNTDPAAARLLALDLHASHMYEQVCHQYYHSPFHNEYTTGIIIQE